MGTKKKEKGIPVSRRSVPPPPPMPPKPTKTRRRTSEVAGGATAECAAVFCCLPCAVMDLLVLTVYKLPAGLVKKAIVKRDRRRIQKKKRTTQMQQNKQNCGVSVMAAPENKKEGLTLLEEHLSAEEAEGMVVIKSTTEEDDMEKEMWARFNGMGFWRSTSQRSSQLPQLTQTNAEEDCVRA
ncbi:hypothetical protein PIB30_043019 [Stylosanthes scabra]|uniref:Uncharacterized protein n=1 Tax=Stylosanthes scabra TaxID=79078 RepID=A0ABU6WGH4_9FABA|nr:hypothetical protein [Stylosanthes scabra]